MDNIGPSNYISWSFLEDYADTFARNFTECSKEVVSESLSEKKLLCLGTELFKILFLPSNETDQIQSIRSVFMKIIMSTNKAYVILSRTWHLMAKDIIDSLIRRNGELNRLEMFLRRINELSELLTDVYFEMGRITTVTRPEVDLDSPEYRKIISSFRKYLEKPDPESQGSELKIHTYYRSLPIELNATVRSVDAQSVTFNVHPYEAVALSSMEMALISSSLHMCVFKAYAGHVDIKERTATFTHFTQDNHQIEKRAYIRVEPKDIIKARMLINNDLIIGRVSDFSEVAATIYARNIDDEFLVPGTTINIEAELPLSVEKKEKTLINSKGTLTKIYNKGDADAHIIVIHWETDSRLKSRLAQYISQRQVEIMRELKELSSDLE